MIALWVDNFGKKDSLITHILFELCLFRNLAQCTFFCSPSSIFVFRYSSTIVLQTVVAATTMTVGLKKPVLKRVSLLEALDAQVKNFVNTV